VTASRTVKPGPRDSKGVLAGRILEVARESFAANGMAGTTVRGVARAAGVDPALVYHYFESKDALLDACTTPPPEFLESVAATWTAPEAELGDRIIRNVVATWNDERQASTLRAILLIAAHDERTQDKLRLVVQHSLMGPATIGLDEEERLTRAGLIATQIMGLAWMRYVWRIEPVASMTDEQVVAAVAPAIQRYVDGPITTPTAG
jgi:AcrR family transcriptional regulator